MRFELDAAMIGALKGGAGLVMGCDHPNLDQTVQVSEEVRKSLVGDLH
jgi:metal-dependent hydrolase (beta-lactamase superfamily II)